MKTILNVYLIVVLFATVLIAQIPWTSHSGNLPESAGPLVDFNHIQKKPGHYNAKDWATVIDTTWGEGLPTATKLQLFDKAWNMLNVEYAAFQNLAVDWIALRDLYRPEIQAGVSRGRFAAIMNHMGLALQETHTWIDDKLVNTQTPLEPGVPLFVVGAWMNNSHFGASLTPMPDSSLLVIKALPNHVLGLIPGDIVLGYDGIPWNVLYKELLAAQLPIQRPYMWGSTEAAMTHGLLMSAGMNWHLFDTLDVFKYISGDTVHYSTASLAGQTGFVWGNEQLDIPGVPWPDIGGEDYFSTMDVFNLEDFISWGIIDGTQIGYVYVIGWPTNSDVPGSNVSTQFFNAVDSLMNYYEITGLIIDGRINFGGDYEYRDAFSLLFNSYIETFAFDKRCGDHYQMCPSTWVTETVSYNVINGNPKTFYDKPIAILTGPGAVSQGDSFPLRMKFHPMVKVFGKSTAGAFSAFYFEDLNRNAGWQIAITNRNLYMVDNPVTYLCHTELEIDEEVWLTQEDVSKGEDTVVKRAIEWIQNLAHAHDVKVNKTYARPGIDSVIVTARVENPNQHVVSLTAILHNMDGVFIDSLGFFDDGKHGDGGADDNQWGNFYLPTDEHTFKVSATTKDISDETSRTLPNVTWFTSVGPVQYVADSLAGDDPYHPQIYITLQNNGSVATATGIVAILSALDTCVTTISNSVAIFGNMPAGETRVRDIYRLYFNQNCPVGTEVPLALSILSGGYPGGYPLWSDTFTVTIPSWDAIVAGTVLPNTFALHQNYPNPFNPTTTIQYQLPKATNVEITIFNLLGQQVWKKEITYQAAGQHEINVDLSNHSSGIYFYRLDAGDFVQTRKMILLK